MPGLIIIIILSNKHQEDFVGRVLKTLTFPLTLAVLVVWIFHGVLGGGRF